MGPTPSSRGYVRAPRSFKWAPLFAVLLLAAVALAALAGPAVAPAAAAAVEVPAARAASQAGLTYILPLDTQAAAATDDRAAIDVVNGLLRQGAPVRWALEAFRAGGHRYPAGTYFVKVPAQSSGRTAAWARRIAVWLEHRARSLRVLFASTRSPVSVPSRRLVLPRIALFNDQTTYLNTLGHWQLFTRMGFEVTLVSARDLLAGPERRGSALSRADVFVMPGGSMHLFAFADDDQRARGVQNLRAFVRRGGAYVGVCAGSTEALAGSPWANLGLVDAGYHSDWMDSDDPAAGDWDWRGLVGPVYLRVTDPGSPVLFGYGAGAVRAGYGPEPVMDYWGGPAMCDEGAGVTVLARYSRPAGPDQWTTDKVKDVWGSAAVVSTTFGHGRVVLFGPHPEMAAGTGRAQDGRMYAQALYYVTTKRVGSRGASAGPPALPARIAPERVRAITRTVARIRPVLASALASARALAALKTGDVRHPLSLWYPETVLVYAQSLRAQLQRVGRYAVTLRRAYAGLERRRARSPGDPAVQRACRSAEARILRFFTCAEHLPTDAHVIAQSDWTGAGPFEPYPAGREPRRFPDLLWSIGYVERELRTRDLPVATAYQAPLAEYDALRAAWQRDPTPANKQAMDACYLAISADDPVGGPLYRGMSTLRHTLDVIQYKVDTPLLDLLTRAHAAQDAVAVARATGR